MYHARDPRYSNSTVTTSWLQSTSAQNRVPSCLKGIKFGQCFTSENIHPELLSLINPALHLLNKTNLG